MGLAVFVRVFEILFVVAILHMCFGSDVAIETGLEFTEEPTSIIVLRGQEVLLNCSALGASSDGEVEISWRKDGLEILAERRVNVSKNGALYIRRVIHNIRRHITDEGRYECVATNRIGAIVSHQAFLQVADLNHFSGHPESSTLSVGETAYFHCEITGVPKPTVMWEKNAQALPPSDRYLQLPMYSLLIYNTTVDDAGKYRCRAENIADQRVSREAELSFTQGGSQHQPEFLLQPKNQEVVAGETAMLQCATTRGGSNGQITWSREDGQALPWERIRKIGFSNIEIGDVQKSDSGVYRCALPDWPEVVPVEATLTVLEPPRSTEPNENIIRPTAHTVRMTCAFAGFPTPNMTWMKNGALVKSNGRIKVKADTGTLLISQSTASDSGLYQCWGENAAGRDVKVIRLFIQPSDNAPDPPEGLEAQTLSSRSIELSWEESPSKNGRRTMAYSVHYLPANGGSELQKVVQEPRAVVDQLLPNTAYTFYVVAYNDRSASQHSEPVTQLTAEDIPTAAPEIQVFTAGSTVLKVQWPDLPEEKARGTIAHYQIIYRKHGQTSQNIIRVDGPINHYNINGLETDVKYDVRVLGGTHVGFPTLTDDQWPWVSQTVSSVHDTGVSDLTDMQVRVINSTTIHLFWELPKSSIELLGFKINYKVQDSMQEPKTIILDSVTNHLIHQLQPDTSYEVSIWPFTDLGEGNFVTKIVHTPADGVVTGLPVPHAITAEPLNDTAILLTWSESEFKGFGVTHFTVRYMPSSSDAQQAIKNDSSPVHSVESHESRVIVTDLYPFTVYQFTIQSHTSTSDSQPSPEVYCKTKEGRPGSPQNVEVILEAPLDIKVNWKPPQISNGVISSYIVYYNDNEIAPISDWLSQVENGTSTTSIISGLKPNTLYYVKLQATTRQCQGKFSKTAEVWTKSLSFERSRNEGHFQAYSDRTMGAIIGISICGGCIIICVIIIILRNRLFLCGQRREIIHGVNGYAMSVQDRRFLESVHHPLQHNLMTAVGKEDTNLPMLNKTDDSDHVDSKGGPLVKKKYDGKHNAELAKTNGFSIYSEQNGSATCHLLSKQEPSTEMSKMSAAEVAVRHASSVTDDSNVNNEATSKL